MSVNVVAQVAEYRRNFDAIYVAGIPHLLNDDGAFLSFLTVLTGTEALAGIFAPTMQNGDRFRAFVARYYPSELAGQADKLWQFRNAMVHAFQPGPYGLTHHASWAHLRVQDGGVILNAQDFYAALLFASRQYFSELELSSELQANFLKRIGDASGGALQILSVQANTGSTGGDHVTTRSRGVVGPREN